MDNHGTKEEYAMENSTRFFLTSFSLLGVLWVGYIALAGEGLFALLGWPVVDVLAAVLLAPIWQLNINKLWRRS